MQIGYQCALKLLRAGAAVHVTTRFPYDALRRYRGEPDFRAWNERLTVHGLDFRDSNSVARFADHLGEGSVDILINNAAQTVRRPADHYRQLVAQELQEADSLPEELEPMICHRQYYEPPSSDARLGRRAELATMSVSSSLAVSSSKAVSSIPVSAQLSLQPVLPEDQGDGHALLPWTHVGNDPLARDFREVTSWTQTIEEVHPLEFCEVYLINAFAPFLLQARLLPALRRSPHARRFVVNVSAREGRFGVRKDGVHPHTNMAKAALNMLTRTIAGKLASDEIYLNAVDPGWVSYQQPYRPNGSDTIVPPLDAIDGAARILDPVFRGVAREERPPFGLLFKDFRQADW